MYDFLAVFKCFINLHLLLTMVSEKLWERKFLCTSEMSILGTIHILQGNGKVRKLREQFLENTWAVANLFLQQEVKCLRNLLQDNKLVLSCVQFLC